MPLLRQEGSHSDLQGIPRRRECLWSGETVRGRNQLQVSNPDIVDGRKVQVDSIQSRVAIQADQGCVIRELEANLRFLSLAYDRAIAVLSSKQCAIFGRVFSFELDILGYRIVHQIGVGGIQAEKV